MIVPFDVWSRSASDRRADICIVGAGAAGLDLAAQLARGHRRVLVLEGGGREFDPAAQRLHRVHESGKKLLAGAHDFRRGQTGIARDEVRTRVFGGTTTVWAGKWKLPDPVDFADRTWIAPGGWPLRWSELEPFARDVLSDYGVPPRLLLEDPGRREISDRERVIAVRHLEQNPAIDFGRRHADVLEKSANVTVVLGANVVELLPVPGGARVGEVVVRALDGKTTRIAADVFVLAVGGIETARLLLASTRFGGRGPGNLHGHVGRGFMDHPKTRLGRFQPRRRALRAGFLSTGRLRTKGIHTRLILPEARQRELQLANHALGLVPLGGSKAQSIVRRVLGSPEPCDVLLFLEQRYNPASRITLDAERDALGMPLADVHWDLLPEDEADARRFVLEMQAAIDPRFGKLEVDDASLARAAWSSSSHHMGAARMAATEREGVADRDGRVFGLENLFIAGCALFPVGGNANPMVLLLALTRRLARHLET